MILRGLAYLSRDISDAATDAIMVGLASADEIARFAYSHYLATDEELGNDE